MPFLTKRSYGALDGKRVSGCQNDAVHSLSYKSSRILFCSSTLSAFEGAYCRTLTPNADPALEAAIRCDSHTGIAWDLTTIAMLYFRAAFTFGLKFFTVLPGVPFIVTLVGFTFESAARAERTKQT